MVSVHCDSCSRAHFSVLHLSSCRRNKTTCASSSLSLFTLALGREEEPPSDCCLGREHSRCHLRDRSRARPFWGRPPLHLIITTQSTAFARLLPRVVARAFAFCTFALQCSTLRCSRTIARPVATRVFYDMRRSRVLAVGFRRRTIL